MKLSMSAWECSSLPTLEAMTRAQVLEALVKDKDHFDWSTNKGGSPCVPDVTVDMTHTAINSWLLMLKDFGLESVMVKYKDRIIDQGIYATLTELDGMATRLLEDRWSLDEACPDFARGLRGLGWPRLKEIYAGVYGCPAVAEMDDVCFGLALLLIRYLLRYSPDDVRDNESVKKFCEVNSKCKKFQRSVVMRGPVNSRTVKEWDMYRPHKVVTSWLRCIASEVLQTYHPVFYDDIAQEGWDHRLPVGALQDTCKCTFCKELKYQAVFHRKFLTPSSEQQYSVRIAAVNKNWKRKRLIAPEDMYHAILEERNAKLIDKAMCASTFSGMLPLHNQEVNRALARAGSISGEYDTHDLSSASDSISRLLAYEVFPRRMHPLFDEFAYKCRVGKGERTLYTFATSGNGCTFILEMILFFSITYCAARLSGYTRREIIRRMKQGKPLFSVYGDDIVCHHTISKALLQLLETLGFTPNARKSFITDEFLYRESCGGEYIRDLDVTPMYWPRNFTNPDTSLPDEYGTNGKTGSFVAIVNRFAFEEDPEWTGENNSHQFLLSKLREYHSTLSLGGAVTGSPNEQTVKCRTAHVNVEDFTQVLRADAEKITVRADLRIECNLLTKKCLVSPFYVPRKEILPFLEKYSRGHENDRWVEAYRTGYKATETVVTATSQRYRMTMTVSAIQEKIAAINRLRVLILDKKILVHENGELYVPREYLSQLNGSSPFTHESLTVTYKLVTGNHTLDECAIAAIAVENSKLPLYGATRGDFSVALKGMSYSCTKKEDVKFSLRYKRTEIKTIRVGHDVIDKPACLCHELSADQRRALWNEFQFERFLELGPVYSTDVMCHESGYIPYSLDRLLNVSKKDRTFEDAYSGAASSLVEKYS